MTVGRSVVESIKWAIRKDWSV